MFARGVAARESSVKGGGVYGCGGE